MTKTDFPDFSLISRFRVGGVLAATLLAFVFCLVALSASAKENPRYASIVLDADTGQIISQENPDKRLYPASLAKMMTLLMTFDALKKGQARIIDRVQVSSHASAMEPSKLDLKPGTTIRLEDAILALVTKSANDVAVALAEHIGGTEDNFARMMTARAHNLGMANTTFRNASGLHNSGQFSTARDMARLARVLIKDYPEYYRYFSKKSFTYQGKTHRNHNRLMETYAGMDGLKTGFISQSGFNLVSSAVRGNRRLIGVIFGGNSTQSRNDQMARLLDRGFEQIGVGSKPVLMASANMPSNTVPQPERKPVLIAALASLSPERQAAVAELNAENAEEAIQIAALNSGNASVFGQMIGEGDFDPVARQRIETGLIAVSAQKDAGQNSPKNNEQILRLPTNYTASPEVMAQPLNNIQPASYTVNQDHDWAIQIGAFSSRARTDQAITQTRNLLPPQMRQQAGATIAPLHTAQGWVFRGRLNGFTKENAQQVCTMIKDCIIVPPYGYQ